MMGIKERCIGLLKQTEELLCDADKEMEAASGLEKLQRRKRVTALNRACNALYKAVKP